MPEMDGLELTRRMRQLDEAGNRCAWVILLTAREVCPRCRKLYR